MSKELDKLEEIKHKIIYNTDGYASLRNEEVNFLITVAKSSLQRLESIDNAKPSEALECSDKTEDNIVERNVDCLLHNIENGHFIKCDVCDVNWHKGCMCCIEHLKNSEEINTIKQSLIKALEQEKENTRYKQLQEELGCPLDVFFEALRKGVYCQFEWNKREEMFYCPVITNGEYFLLTLNQTYDTIIYFNDYKKTWWLREDKSE